jgi:hypothetical protein
MGEVMTRSERSGKRVLGGRCVEARDESKLDRRRCEELSDYAGFSTVCADGTRFLRVWSV